eukprot:sb/3474416/
MRAPGNIQLTPTNHSTEQLLSSAPPGPFFGDIWRHSHLVRSHQVSMSPSPFFVLQSLLYPIARVYYIIIWASSVCQIKSDFFEVVTPLLSRGVVFVRDSPLVTVTPLLCIKSQNDPQVSCRSRRDLSKTWGSFFDWS